MKRAILLLLLCAGLASAQTATSTTTPAPTTINAEKLQGELVAAGVPSVGCNGSGTVWGISGVFTDKATLATIATVISAHNPSLTLDQKLRAIGCTRLEWASVVLAASSSTKTEKAAAQAYVDLQYSRMPK